jgi:nicotinamide mononucleotide transporter
MQDVKELLDYSNIDFIQCAVLILGVSEVLLARANNVWLYPTGILAIVLSIYSLLKVQLFGECLLHLYYLVMSVYGWWYWLAKQNNEKVKVTHVSKKEWGITAMIVFGGWILLYYFLATFTPSEVPVWDAWISATGWAGMWLLARRKVENWILLNISNAFAIPLLFHKELPLFAILTLFLFFIACKAYFDWARIAKKEFALQSINDAI